jgi:arylamine N-acetyltransferase
MNMGTSQSPESHFFEVVMATTVQFNENLQAISRKLLVHSRFQKRKNGSTERLATFKTEDERIDAIEREFGVKLSLDERNGIKGRKVALDQFQTN